MKLYNFSRSSASYRVRIVANLKGLTYDYASINLMRGESRNPSYQTLNPQGRVPTLEDNGRLIPQSMGPADRPLWPGPRPSTRARGCLRDSSNRRRTRAELSHYSA